MSDPISTEDFGPYRLTHLLGKGGMASVFRAVRSGPMGFSKQVAIKRLHPALTENEAILKALINEARLGGQLKHPNIVEIYEFNKVGESYYLAMEFIDGWTLDRVAHLGRKHGLPMPPEVVLDIGIQVCLALDYAHNLQTLDGQEVRLVHRDLKPANIILGHDGSAKIMDFGIAKAETNLFKTTAGEVTKGTPHYMSPEQVAGAADLGPPSDIFSMGSVLYELFTGRVLFSGDSLVSILFAVARAQVGERLTRADVVVPGIGALLQGCLTRDPTQRIGTATALGEHLEKIRKRFRGDTTIKEYLFSLRDRVVQMDADVGNDSDTQGNEPGPQFATLISPELMERQIEEAHELRSAQAVADAEINSSRIVAPEMLTASAIEGIESFDTAIFNSSPPQTDTRSETPPEPERTTAPETKVRAQTAPATPKIQTRGPSAIGPVLVLLLVITGLIGGATLLLDTQPEAQPELPTPAPRSVTPTLRAPTPAPRTPAPVQASNTVPPTPVSSPAQVSPGYLKIKSSKPYFGWVQIDGKKQPGLSTPVHGRIELSAGPHTVRLESSNRPGSLGRKKTVTIRPGKTTVLGTYDFVKEKWQQ